MSARYPSLVGKKFNKLTVVELVGSNARRQRFWACVCECGGRNERVETSRLTSGHTKSCGCLSKFDEDLTGKKFHRLTVLRYLGKPPRGSGSWWECQCECGNVTNVTAPYLRFGHTKSCGCLQREAIKATNAKTNANGWSKTVEYVAWQKMQWRCSPGHPNHKDYHDRGITVCPEWSDKKTGFRAFIAHMGERPAGNYSIDRINNDEGYRPGNVRWATRTDQNDNKRRAVSMSRYTMEELMAAEAKKVAKQLPP